VLFAVYAGTLGMHALRHADYGGDEPHHLLAARSLVRDGDVDLANQYAQRQYRSFYPYALRPYGRLTEGHRNEPSGIGFPLAIAPVYAAGGPRAVELFVAAFAALAFVLAVALARRLVPEPWATAGPLVCALSPPALAYSTAVQPEALAGALLAGACLLALAARERPRLVTAAGAAVLLAPLPWLGVKFLPAGAVVAAVLVRWLLRRGRGLAALVVVEVIFASLVSWVAVNERLYDGLTPYSAGAAHPATGAGSAGGYAGRAGRLVALWIDRDYGLLRWAPFLALAFLAVWLLWRSRRERLARVIPERLDAEVAAGLLAAAAGAQVLVAAFLAPTMFGPWFPGRQVVAVLPLLGALSAWGLRFARRVGTVLAALTLVGSVWLYIAIRVGDTGWDAPTSSAPWGPLERLLPPYSTSAAWPDAVSWVVAAALAALVAREWLRRRERVAV
jgi:hypothetical protein